MRTKHLNLFFLIFILPVQTLFSQTVVLDSAIQNAINHRQTQNAAHNILWGISHNIMEESWVVDQEKGEMTVQRGTSTVSCKIKIIGTYDHKDSTFLWSIYNKSIDQNLTEPVRNLMKIANINNWKVFSNQPFKCTFQKAFNLASLVFYYDNANGISHKMTNQNRTNVFFSFYDIEIRDRIFKVFNKTIKTQKQYKIANSPELIEICKKYIIEFDKNEKKYHRLYTVNNNQKYLDTMFINQVKISDSFWDTTSISYPYFRKNRLQAQSLKTIDNWRVILIDDDIPYVLYDERENWGHINTWAFELYKVNNQYRIRNEYMCQ